MSRRIRADTPPNEPDASNGREKPPAALLRTLPSVDDVLRHLAALPDIDGQSSQSSHEATVRAVRAAVAEARTAILAGGACPNVAALAERTGVLLTTLNRPALRPVINATGVIINTNLGRAPLSAAAMAAMTEVAGGYSNLEYDLDVGERGSRHTHVRDILRELSGAEDALVVNNNAAAVLVVLSALAAAREVIVSRGELVEIGGGFRVPDVLRQGGARLVEVGTTNRTRLRDYEAAITSETSAFLAVHPSNFRVVGFTEVPELGALARLAHERGLALVHDLGSGCLGETARWGLAHEPTVHESVAAGVDVTCFSGDKLLGGPQAGILVGRSALLAQVARHPLMRAVRIDKLTLAALEATLRLHRDRLAERDIPVWQAIAMPLEAIRQRASQWVVALHGWGIAAEVIPGSSTVGGGSLPGETEPTLLCAISAEQPDGRRDLDALAARLRAGHPPVVARVLRDRLLLDPRTVLPDQDALLLDALRAAAEPAANA
ncbi:MAG TPA: L-seryl-tRNA(Sec) selenium transferase [Ktedonobacterales bacterium]|nr:L-seryl-tRNA(Sec) selenium transferase [Ktedonobacterales bacterium]